MNTLSKQLNKYNKRSSDSILAEYITLKEKTNLVWEAWRESTDKNYISPLRSF